MCKPQAEALYDRSRILAKSLIHECGESQPTEIIGAAILIIQAFADAFPPHGKMMLAQALLAVSDKLVDQAGKQNE